MRFLKLLLCVLPWLCACPRHAGAAFFTHPSACAHPVNDLPFTAIAVYQRDTAGVRHMGHRRVYTRNDNNHWGVASLICLGLVALAVALVTVSPTVAMAGGPLLSLIAIILGTEGSRHDKKTAMSILGIIFGILFLIVTLFIALAILLGA